MAEEMTEEKTAEDHASDSIHSAVEAILKSGEGSEEMCKKLEAYVRSMLKKKEPEGEKKPEGEDQEMGDDKMEKQEQTPVDRGELFEQAAAIKPRVDKGVIHHVHVLGNVSKWGYRYSTEAQKAAAPRFEGMLVGIDHDYQSNPLRVGEAFGTLRNPSVDADGTWADLHYLTTHEQAPMILEDLDRGTGIFALSSVSSKAVEQRGVITSFLPTRCDVVAGGATTKTLLESRNAPSVTKEQFDALQAKTAELEKRLILREQFVAPQSSLQQEIKKVVAPIGDMKRFFDPKIPA